MPPRIRRREREVMQCEGNLQNHAGIRSSCMVLRQDGSALWQQARHQRRKRKRVPRLGHVNFVVEALPDSAANVRVHGADARASDLNPKLRGVRHLAARELLGDYPCVELEMMAHEPTATA